MHIEILSLPVSYFYRYLRVCFSLFARNILLLKGVFMKIGIKELRAKISLLAEVKVGVLIEHREK